MLLNIDIKNVAVIEKLSFEPGKNMSVLTGETGAGKSIIIDSVNLILGARSDKNLVRYGEEKAVVSALFDTNPEIISFLEEIGVDIDEESIIITREITKDGKSVARINGTMVPLQTLRELSKFLINIHGQHDNQSLLNHNKHINFLDKYSGDDDLLLEYKKEYQELKKLKNEYQNLSCDEEMKAQRIDFLKFQIEELEKANLKVGEFEELEEEYSVISNAEKISENANIAYSEIFAKENCAYDVITNAVSSLAKISQYDKTCENILERLNDCAYQIEDIGHELRSYSEGVEFDEEHLEVISARIDLIKKLSKKYGGSVENCIDYYNKIKAELDNLENFDSKKEELAKSIEKAENKATEIAKKLSKVRVKSAKILSESITNELHDLDMPRAIFNVSITPEEKLGENGLDKVEFNFSANPGQGEKPLEQIASGGELSRTMLAIKTVLSDIDNVDTLIFDEIDTGVSGNASTKIAKKLKLLGKTKQVICISHQVQLASMADSHFKISKIISDDNTKTDIKMLDREERIKEIAIMIDGDSFDELSINHAKEMLQKGEIQG